MPPPHICTQEETIGHHDSELYFGRDNRQPYTVRMQAVELRISALESIARKASSAGITLLLATIIAVCTAIWQTIQTTNKLEAALSTVTAARK